MVHDFTRVPGATCYGGSGDTRDVRATTSGSERTSGHWFGSNIDSGRVVDENTESGPGEAVDGTFFQGSAQVQTAFGEGRAVEPQIIPTTIYVTDAMGVCAVRCCFGNFAQIGRLSSPGADGVKGSSLRRCEGRLDADDK